MKYSVIIAEDEILLLNNLAKKINESNTNFEVVGTAQTGIQALDLVNKLEPDLLITDIKMPVMDGLSLIKNVKDYHPDIDFIITSGFSDFEYAQTALKYQVKDYLLKPVDRDELYSALNQLEIKYNAQCADINKRFISVDNISSPAALAQIIKEYLVDHFSEDIDLKLIAQELNYSPSYLTKIFTNQYQCPPSKYLLSIRIQKAEHMLLHNPELSIRQIGEAVGYLDQGYFSRIFKKQTGKSPLDYREK